MKPSSHKAVLDLVVKELMRERKSQKLSHETIAQRTKLSRAAISMIEARKREPTLLTLLRIADALECDLGQVVTAAVKEAKK